MTVVAESRQKNTSSRPGFDDAMRPRRRWSLLIAGLLLVLLCAGVFAVVQLGRDARTQVLAISRSMAAGQLIGAEDLRVVAVVPDPSLPLVPAGRAQQVVGRSAAVPLTVGTLLSESQLGPARWPEPGQAVVAAGFKPGRVPAGVAPGAHALVVTVATDGGPGDSGLSSVPASVPATVMEVAPGVDGSGTTVVSLLLARDDATRLASAGSELCLVLVAG